MPMGWDREDQDVLNQKRSITYKGVDATGVPESSFSRCVLVNHLVGRNACTKAETTHLSMLDEKGSEFLNR